MGKRTSTSWQKGQSGNPKGRPPKGRALTELLENFGNKTTDGADGERRAYKRELARLIWELSTTGRVTLPGTRVLAVRGIEQLLEVWQFLYGQIDGPPVRAFDFTSDGDAIVPAVTFYLPDNGRDDRDDRGDGVTG